MKYDYLNVVRTHEVEFILKQNKNGAFEVDEKATIKRFKYLLESEKVGIETIINKQSKRKIK